MRVFCGTIFLIALALAGGCAPKGPSPNDKINNWLISQQVQLPQGVYRIEPPDVITVSAPRIPELNGRTATVGADGKVSFNLVGSIEVMGKTTEQVAIELSQKCSRFYGKEALDIAVVVTEFKSKFIYVFGQVEQPGIKPYTGRDSIVQILAQAKLNDRAWAERIVVVRPNEDVNIKQRTTLDLANMYEKGDMRENIHLEDGDVVYVPPSPLAQVNMTFNRILAPITPSATLLRFALGGF